MLNFVLSSIPWQNAFRKPRRKHITEWAFRFTLTID